MLSKTFLHTNVFLHGISHTKAVILSNTRHEQTGSIPHSPSSGSLLAFFFPSCFQLKNTLVAFFFYFMTADWCERAEIIWWKSVCLLVSVQLKILVD